MRIKKEKIHQEGEEGQEREGGHKQEGWISEIRTSAKNNNNHSDMNDPDLLRSHSDLSEKLHRVIQEKNAIELKLIQETKEHEKTQALLQQQQQFLKDREAEFAAREHDLIARNERYKREKDEELEEEKSRAELEVRRRRMLLRAADVAGRSDEQGSRQRAWK